MALHSRDAVTVSAAVATRSRADCSSREGHTSLSTALVLIQYQYSLYNNLVISVDKILIAIVGAMHDDNIHIIRLQIYR